MDNYEFDNNRIKRFKDRVHLIIKQLKDKEKREERELKAKSKLEFIPEKDLLKISLFSRNPFEKMNIFKFNLSKQKMKMEMINRNLERNKVEYALKQVALHYINPKSRINLNDQDVIFDLKKKIMKNKKIKESISSKRLQSRSTDHNNNQSFNKQPHYNKLQPKHSKSERKIYPIKIMKNKNNSVCYNNSHIDQSFSMINNTNKLSKTRYSTMHSKIKAKPQSAIVKDNKRQHEVKTINKPICTTNINKFVQKYLRFKKQIAKDKIRFEQFLMVEQKTIDSIMAARSEMKLINLKHQFQLSNIRVNSSQLPFKNTKQKFREDIVREFESIDWNYHENQ